MASFVVQVYVALDAVVDAVVDVADVADVADAAVLWLL